MEYSKPCPTCGKTQVYANKYKLWRALDRNSECKSCSALKRESDLSFREKCGKSISKTWTTPTPKRKKWLEDRSIRNMNRGRVPYSKLEMTIGEVLTPLGFKHGIKSKRILGLCPDWINEDRKIIVEVFGSFWHADPKKYSADWIHPKNGWTAQEIWSRDKERISLLEQAGYEVVIVWESSMKRSVLRRFERLSSVLQKLLTDKGKK